MDIQTLVITAIVVAVLAFRTVEAFWPHLLRTRREIHLAWKFAAEDMGLVYTKPRKKRENELHGRLRGFEVEVKEISEDKLSTRILVEIHGLDPGFTLGRDNASQNMIKPDIETGDSLFDERTRIEGDPDWALALLGDEARRLTEFVTSGLNGQLTKGSLVASCEKIEHAPSTLETLLDLAVLLRQPALDELPNRLLERACHDPLSSVRLQAFRRLISSSAFREQAHEAAETLLDSPYAFLRLEACRFLLRSGSGKSDHVAEELVALATGDPIDSSVRRLAIETLVESRPRAAVILTMNQILQEPNTPPVVRTSALEGLVRVGAKEELLEIRTDDEAEAEILARGLGNFDVSVQPRLLELLEDPEDRVRLAAVKSLGRVGDLDAIRALRQVVGQEDHSFQSALVREVEHAIDEIKGRSGGSQHGEISIIEVAPLEGAISPSDGDSEAGGEVSLTS